MQENETDYLSPNELRQVIESILFLSQEPRTIAEIKKIINETIKARLTEESRSMGPAQGSLNHEEDKLGDQTQDSQLGAVILPFPRVSVQNEDGGHEARVPEYVTGPQIQECLDQMAIDLEADPMRGLILAQVALGYQLRTKDIASDFVRHLFKLPKPRLSAPSLETLAIIAYQQPVSRIRIEEIRGVDAGGVLKTLLERDLIRTLGRSEDVGKAMLYGTTDRFLETFSLGRLTDLPKLEELMPTEHSGTQVEVQGDASVSEDDNWNSLENLLEEESMNILGKLDASIEDLTRVEAEVIAKTQAASEVAEDSKTS